MVGQCIKCKKDIEVNPRHAPQRKYCSDGCRYAYWKDEQEKKLHKLLKSIAGRGIWP